jgi:hypothetical protein
MYEDFRINHSRNGYRCFRHAGKDVAGCVFLYKGVFVANLKAFPIGSGSVARYTISSLRGVSNIRARLTPVFGMVVSGDDTYFLQLRADADFPQPEKGTIERLRNCGLKTVATGRTFPTGMTMDPRWWPLHFQPSDRVLSGCGIDRTDHSGVVGANRNSSALASDFNGGNR